MILILLGICCGTNIKYILVADYNISVHQCGSVYLN